MKAIFALLSISIVLPAFGNSIADYRARFDGNYELTGFKGTSTYYRVIDCTDPVRVGPNTLDARKTECTYEAVPQEVYQYCPERLNIHNNAEVIFLDGMNDLLGDKRHIGDGLEDKTELKKACEGLDGFSGFFGCVIVQTTGFMHEVIQKKSELNEVSFSYKTKETGEHEFIGLKKEGSSVVVTRKGLERSAGGKKRNPKSQEWDFTCSYKKQ